MDNDVAYIKTESASDELIEDIEDALEDAGFKVGKMSLGGRTVER